jgi:predicted double-glycine peptidase
VALFVGAFVIAAIYAILVSFTSSIYPMLDQPKSEIDIAVSGPGSGYIRTYVNPSSEIKKDHSIKQGYDFSCGSASLAIILNFYLGEKFTEKQVIQGLLHYGDVEKISKRQAFSLLDMKKFVTVLGYQGDGYEGELDDLKSLTTPCIVPIKIFEYNHFVVFRGIHNGHVFVADPWRGDSSYTINDFYDMWGTKDGKKVMFVVSKENGQVLSNLRLKEEDLNFINEDEARQIIFANKNNPETASSEREFKLLQDAASEKYYYKGRK